MKGYLYTQTTQEEIAHINPEVFTCKSTLNWKSGSFMGHYLVIYPIYGVHSLRKILLLDFIKFIGASVSLQIYAHF